MTKIHVLQYALAEDVEVANDGGEYTVLDDLATPQISMLATDETLDAALVEVQTQVLEELVEAEYDTALVASLVWWRSESVLTHPAARRHFWCDLLPKDILARGEWSDVDVQARIVVQEMEVTV